MHPFDFFYTDDEKTHNKRFHSKYRPLNTHFVSGLTCDTQQLIYTKLAASDTASAFVPLCVWKFSWLSLRPPPPPLFWSSPLRSTHPSRPGSDCILSLPSSCFLYWNESLAGLAPHFTVRVAVCLFARLSLSQGNFLSQDIPPIFNPQMWIWHQSALCLHPSY